MYLENNPENILCRLRKRRSIFIFEGLDLEGETTVISISSCGIDSHAKGSVAALMSTFGVTFPRNGSIADTSLTESGDSKLSLLVSDLMLDEDMLGVAYSFYSPVDDERESSVDVALMLAKDLDMLGVAYSFSSRIDEERESSVDEEQMLLKDVLGVEYNSFSPYDDETDLILQGDVGGDM